MMYIYINYNYIIIIGNKKLHTIYNFFQILEIKLLI